MMNSFFFWLTAAAGVGALLSQIVNPGLLEIVIVVALANVAFYGYRRMTRTRLLPA
ncbi:hypothetical protein Poly21_19080 [Allorhodopirellula heiligendammensis]|uniref:Uncharacterized protein n=1 Tax=Allorhodopirellula heiligendammensis TaxID=2714739 RepID=A0A5C6C593_9BACT|nr:hypothetical protein Poly21_19080 [Allorhodopirellula heiligendammensis]